MNVNNNLKYNNSSVARLFRDSLAKKLLYNNHNIFKAADSFSIINESWSYNIDSTNEIVSNIANATKSYAYNTSDSKWYVKNNLGNYEQWGLMPTVSDLNNVTTYTGKLVGLSTDSHEYKWNGTQWVDLGSYIVIRDYWLKGSTTSSKWLTDYVPNTNTEIEIKVLRETRVSSWTAITSVVNGGAKRCNILLNGSGYYIGYGFGSNYDDYAATFLPNTIYVLKLNKTGFYVNGTQVGSFNQSINNMNYVQCIGGPNGSGTGDSDDCFQGKIYYLKIWENGTLVRNYQPQADYTFKDSVTQHVATLSGYATYGYDEGGSVIPEEYPEKPAPTLLQTKSSYQAALNGSYLNGQTVKVYNKTYDVSNGKLCESEITYPYITFDNTYTNNKIYGWLLRTDYPDAGSYSGWDIMFGSNMGSSEIVPRMSSQYNGGVYTDLTFTDLSIKANLPTLSYNGHNWYYYYFQDTTGCYLQQGQAATTETNTYYTTYMMFITAPQN